VLALVASLGTATSAHGQDRPDAVQPQQATLRVRQAARTELWLALSATLITAAATGAFALKVAALHDRKATLPENSPERPVLDQQVVDARRYAFGFGTMASLLTLTSVLVLLSQPGPPDATDATTGTATLTPTLSSQHVGVVCRGSF
jgi:hypothetical protein